MKKVKNRITAYINENLKHEDQFDSIKNKLNLQHNKYRESNYFMKSSRVLKIALPVLLLVVALVIGVALIGNPIGKTEEEATAVVQMDVNPSISLVINSEEKVISVYGENDEGKMIISNEEIIGLELSEAIQKIITIESETGYLVKGNVSVEDNNISISIEAKEDEIAKKVQMEISSTINKICEKLNIKENLEVVQTTSKDQLVKRALQLDSTLTEEEAKRLSNTAAGYGLTAAELLQNFTADLTRSNYTNGSDERMHANNWAERCWFSFMNNNLLKHLHDIDYDVDDFITAWDEKLYYEAHPEEFKEEVANLEEGEKLWFHEEIDDVLEHWKPDYNVHIKTEIELCRKWLAERDRLLNTKEE